MTATENKWTYDRPTESGWYWAIVGGAPEVAYVYRDAGHFLVCLTDEDAPERLTHCYGWQWWPVPIAPPPEPVGVDYVGP